MSPRALQVGDTIDGFRLEDYLHQGGMAHLWRVSHPGHAMPLLMKVPRIKGGEDPATIVGFEVEQMILPRLHGPHVPAYVAQGDFTGQPYLVMEHLAGESLRPRLDRAPLPADEVAAIGAKVAAALHELHRQHVIHLDVKPSNILFRHTADGRETEAVLVDYGLARHDHLPDLLDEEFTLPMGTGPYMSPEQIQFVRSEPRSDLYALGVMLYHLATGERPFGQPTSVAGLRQRLYREPIPPRALRPACPPWLQEIILRCLEPRAEQRHETAGRLAFDLLHPQQVALTARATRLGRAGRLKVLRRWIASLGAEPLGPGGASAALPRHAILMAAVDVSGTPELLDALRQTVRHFLQAEAGARLACVGVMKTARIGMDELLDAEGRSRHVQQLVALKHWARPLQQALGLDGPARAGRVTFHVLEAPDPAAAIVDFARRNEVDHVLMGARSASPLRRYLGSVSAQVVAESPCSVTVVRDPAARAG
ncbi:MAG TPA: bifunctional serine/threonine-protein kinase/universal stress protein [Methylibium sp.]|nr:bifunctional serine/threonine-protein kinase/universal stress protein [Methylibium sp.]